MMPYAEQLVKMGLTKGEAKVYLALIEKGSSTVGPIVRGSGVAYSNIYEILQRLMKKGLVVFVIKNKTKYFQSADPEYLKEYLEKKEAEVSKSKTLADEIVPKIRKMQKIAPEQEAEIYTGYSGLRSAYVKAFGEHKGEWLWFYEEEDEYAKDVDALFLSLMKVIKGQKLDIKGIANERYMHSRFSRRFRKFINCKYISFPTPGNVDIIGNRVMITSLKKSVVGFVINSQTIANDMRKYFYSVWKVAKP